MLTMDLLFIDMAKKKGVKGIMLIILKTIKYFRVFVYMALGVNKYNKISFSYLPE